MKPNTDESRQPVTEREPVPQPKPAATVEPSETELGGPSGPEPTRYGDWERGGRCTDF